jgi:Zn-dependent protease/predicted transcriptional regulator
MNIFTGGGIPIARIFDIEIRIHLSWVVILAVITVGVGTELIGSEPGWSDVLRWAVGGTVALLFLVSVLAHELAHGLVARRRGMGGGTVTLLFFGGATTQGSEPAKPSDEATVAAAGPIASGLVTAAFLGASFVGLAIPGSVGEAVGQVSIVLAVLNALLALLNMVPVYPLDGGRVLHAILWQTTGTDARASHGVAIVSRGIGWLLIAAGLAVMLVGDSLDGVMLTICGWFLGGTARSVERRVTLENMLRGLSVESVMERDLPAVSPQLTLDTFAAQYLASGEGTSLPVMRDEKLLGLIGVSQLRRIRQSSWPTMRAADVMVSPPTLPTLAPDDELWGALERLRRTGLDGLPVLRGTELLGVLTRRGVVQAIQSRGRPAVGAAT